MIPKFDNSVLHTFLIKDIDINANYNKTIITFMPVTQQECILSKPTKSAKLAQIFILSFYMSSSTSEGLLS